MPPRRPTRWSLPGADENVPFLMSGQLSARPVPLAASSRWSRLVVRLDRSAGAVFILPAVLVILIFSIFPLLASLYVYLTHFIGVTVPLTPLTAAVLFVVYGGFAFLLVRYLRGPGRTVLGFVGRLVTAVSAGALVWLVVDTVMTSGRPGTLVVTLIYVGVDVSVQYLLALGLALLVVQRLPGRRFFRVVFLLPMMITPVGVAYLFRMLTDTSKGPLYPLWAHFGLTDVSWVTNPWGARLAVMIGDVWQWTPFIFIVLLASIESLPVELNEAAVVDGANRWQMFWAVTFPQILPATSTVVLIRLIEAFKIVDLPNVLTNGGPGTATESLTLHAYTIWRALDIGGSAAVAYMLLIVVTFVGISYVNLFRRRVTAMA